jgi:integrase/recombinase XerC/integrase/recombinase XerD
VPLPDTSVDQFYQHVLRLNNENTAGKYRLAATKFEHFCGQYQLPLGDLPPGVLSLFSEVLVTQGLRPNSVAVMSAGAKKYLKWLQASGAITPKTFMSPDLPRIRTEQPTSLRDDDLMEYFRFASVCPEPARTAIMLLPFCGLRSNELTNLLLSSIKKFEVPKMGGGTIAQLCFHVEKGKGGDPRTVPLLLDGRPILVSYLSGWRASQFGEYLFPGSDGQPISNRVIRHYVQWIRESMAAAGRNPDKLTPHTLRRTYITTLWRAGLDVPTIVKIAGHKNVQTTLTHYLAIQPEDMANSVHNKHISLIAKGPYADKVRAASGEVNQFLDSLKNEDEDEDK